jgi:hypothetical protein
MWMQIFSLVSNSIPSSTRSRSNKPSAARQTEYSTLSAKFPEVYLYITNIAKSCNLEVLSLLSLPTDYASIQSIGFFAAKDAALARLATEIFAIHRSHSTLL